MCRSRLGVEVCWQALGVTSSTYCPYDIHSNLHVTYDKFTGIFAHLKLFSEESTVKLKIIIRACHFLHPPKLNLVQVITHNNAYAGGKIFETCPYADNPDSSSLWFSSVLPGECWCTSKETCALLGYYAASNGNFLPTFWNLRMGLKGCPETSVRNYHYSLRNNPGERSSKLLRGGSLKSRVCLPP